MEYRLANKKDALILAEMRWDIQLRKSREVVLGREDFITHCADSLKSAFDRDLFCFVAVDGEKIVSHIFIECVHKIPKPHKLDSRWGYVTNVDTLPEYRNKGIGSELMRKAKEWCKSEGFEHLIVWPSEKSVNFYVRAGFSTENDVMELAFD